MSEEPTHGRQHPIRLAVFMLVGAFIGQLFLPLITGFLRGPVTTNTAGLRQLEDHLICAVAGAFLGIVVEHLVRIGQRD